MSMGWPEVLLIMAVVLLLFGASKLPELARSLGKAASEFKKAKNEGDNADGSGKKPEDKHDA